MMVKGIKRARTTFQNGDFKRARWYCGLLCSLLLTGLLTEQFAYGETDPNERFKNVEIRVIRPRYFTKRKRVELGAQFTSIMNESFIYLAFWRLALSPIILPKPLLWNLRARSV